MSGRLDKCRMGVTVQPTQPTALPILLQHRRRHAAPACTAQGQTFCCPAVTAAAAAAAGTPRCRRPP